MATEETPVEETAQPVVSPITLPELTDERSPGEARPIDVLGRVRAEVVVVAGRATMTLAQVKALTTGDLIALDRGIDATVDILVNGMAVATGDVVVLDDHLAARIATLEAGDLP
ncbi:MAG: FliM/FliN family flagellar motor switch protein [Acidimicrobiia bacterium]|nr:FliM/FliN family flagellar motor switch protein [Acidimicrobiia bacterium]MDH4307001.1 FliM/FliN family flagellar motor switch protein [Acidimicrobiia bacterium]